MILNDFGHAVEGFWNEIPKHFPFIELNEHVIMPNHVHGILIIRDYDSVGANNHSPLRETPNGTSGTIGSVVRGFKIGATKWSRTKTNIHNVWQRNYHERVIRDERELFETRKYILDNPLKWGMDPEYA
ncbi:MAG: hypothetical protein WC641_06025 [Patescibacteria group bacterium]